MKVDLHTHSTYSDGTDSLDDLILKCRSNGIEYVSLTDHDCIGGTKDFLKKASSNGINAIPGIEFSAEHPTELHILCYNYDQDDPVLNDALNYLLDERKTRIVKMMRLLQDDGFRISDEELQELIGNGVPTRPHIGQLLVNKGYCKTVKEAFERYIGVGCKYFVKKGILTKEEIFSISEKASGTTVLAHPAKIHEPDFEKLLHKLLDFGLKGIEVFYPIHSDRECSYYMSIADRYGLMITQGSDNHGTRRNTYLGKETRGNENELLMASVQKLFRK